MRTTTKVKATTTKSKRIGLNRGVSQKLLTQSLRHFPGGVNSPVRAFRAVGGNPPFIRKARGCFVTDEDGNKYIDYVGSWGPAILGHAPATVVRAVARALPRGLSYGAPTKLESELAERIKRFFPSIEKMRFTSSGTEACMSAIRVARGYTGREGIIKIDGAYHGHCDSLLVKAGSGATTFSHPDSGGVPKDFARHTFMVPFNDLPAIERVLHANPKKIAGVILEPVMGNIGLVAPEINYLRELRKLCTQYGAVLIFDEVMTGFRVHPTGAQGYFDVVPDMTCLGKVVGGGLPLAVYGGKREIMAVVSPEGEVYQGGTLSGNPAAVTAGIATLDEISRPGFYQKLFDGTEYLAEKIRNFIELEGVPLTLTAFGSMFCLFFLTGRIRSYDDVKKADREKFGRYFNALLTRGVYVPPSQFETLFVSAAHRHHHFDATFRAIQGAVRDVFGGR